jgi:general nucleoside transport system permease protein
VNDSVAVLSIVGAITVGTPIALAALGEILTERSGVMNLGVEGMMLTGAVVGFGAMTITGSVWPGVAAGALAAAVLALLHAVLSVSLRVNQIISGLALVVVGTGLSSFLGRIGETPLVGREAVSRFSPLLPPGVRDLPLIGPVVLGHDLMVYVTLLLTALASYYLFRTRLGLSVRAVGEDPAAADAAGLSVPAIRYAHTVLGGAMGGAGGAYLSIEILGTWQSGITAGVGWIAFALVIFSGWRPWVALVAAIVFGGLRNLGFTLQILGIGVASDFLSMLPFILTILALIVASSRPAWALGPPAALARPYVRESR